jgi:hypothetical protein
MNSTYRDIATAIADSPVVDTHDHLRPAAQLPQPMTLAGLFRTSFVARAMRDADGSPTGAVDDRTVSRWAENTWEATADVIAKVRFTSYYHWLLRGLVELYDLPQPELTPAAWEQLNAELPARYSDPTWPGRVLDRAHVETVIWDPFWRPGTWEGHDPRLLPSFRISSALVAFHADAVDYVGCNLIRDWSAHFNLDVRTLSDLEVLIDRLLDENIRAGCRSLKSPIAYDRSLAIGPGTRTGAEKIFGRAPGSVTEEEGRAFGDYVMRFLLDRARERRLVVQVHTGMARLSGSNPLLLASQIEQYPEVVFDVFHGGYPWIHEVGALAQNYPNVRLNLAWLPQLTTEAAVVALKEWLQVVPQTDRISWGADSWTVEEMYGALAGAKHVLSRALSEFVDEGYLGLEEAIDAASSVLYGGGRAIYGTSAGPTLGNAS